MDHVVKLGENLFKRKVAADVKKELTFAKFVEKGDKTYFQAQFEVITTDAKNVKDPEDLGHRKTITTDGSMLTDNCYKVGTCEVTMVDGNTSKLQISLQIVTKQPGGGSS